MFNLVGEALDRTHRKALLRRILAGRITLCQERIYNLCISLCSQGSALQQWLSEENTPSINVRSRLNIIQRIHNRIQRFKEIMSKYGFCIRSNRIFINLEFSDEIRIHDLDCFHCCIRLELADIGRSKEELSIEIGFLDTIQIGDCQIYAIASTDSHHGPILEHFTTNSPCSDKEEFQFRKFVMEIPSKYSNLSIVP